MTGDHRFETGSRVYSSWLAEEIISRGSSRPVLYLSLSCADGVSENACPRKGSPMRTAVETLAIQDQSVFAVQP